MDPLIFDVETVFEDPFVARPAEWRPGDDPDSEAVAIRVIPRAPDEVTAFGGGRFVQASLVVEVLVSAVPGLERGDGIRLFEVWHRVSADPVRDATRSVWIVELVPA